MFRILIALMTPAVGLAAGGVVDGGPLFGGPRAVVTVYLEDYPARQEVFLEVFATSDRPGAERKSLGRSKKAVGANGKIFINVFSDPLPDAEFLWKVQYTFTPRAGTNEVHHLYDYTLRRDHLTVK